jgi:hypothetical protein
VLLGIIGLVFLSFAAPFFSVAVSLCLAFVTHACRDHLWPKASSTSSLTWSLIAWLGLWLPGPLLLSIFGFEPSIVWLVIPLCSPDGLNAVLLPALAVAVTCFAGLLGTVITRRAWPWVATAWLAPWVHHVVFSQTAAHGWVC